MLKKFIKNNLTLSSLVFLSFIIIVNNFFRFFQNNTAYEFDPWLSNYQGGFVRRGIPGEIFYQMHNLLGIHPGWVVFIFVSILYFLFYLNFFNLIKNIKLNILHIFIIFSPISFYFPVLNSKASGHKEILFLFFLSFFSLLIPKLKKKEAGYAIILISIILGLSYEVLLFYLIFFIGIFVLFFNFKSFKDLFRNLAPIVLVIISLIFINYYFSGNINHTKEICNSISNYVNPDCKKIGKIADLSLTLDDHTSQKGNWNYGKSSLYFDYFKIYGFGLLYGFLPLILFYKKIKFTKIHKKIIKLNPGIILFLLLICGSPVYYLGADWGRYMYISYISSIIFTFFCLKNKVFAYKKKIVPIKYNIFTKLFIIISLIIYSLGWTVPICCEKKFKPGIIKVIERSDNYLNKKT